MSDVAAGFEGKESSRALPSNAEIDSHEGPSEVKVKVIGSEVSVKDSDSKASKSSKRVICPRCDRPALSACICVALPDQRIQLNRSHCWVLQHPHEAKCKNRSLPLVELCLDPRSITVTVGRRFDLDPAAATQLQRLKLCSEDQPVWLLSREEGAVSLTQAIKDQKNNKQEITVIVLDGTWKVRRTESEVLTVNRCRRSS
jgi:DTW domain-containing protein YfiP